MNKKILTALCLFTMGVSLQVSAQSWAKKSKTGDKKQVWFENFEKAQEAAEESKKPIFVLFTGSDWCPWCIKLEKEALGTKQFKSFAKDNMILFKADYLRSKPMSAELKQKNDALRSKYGVRGFPTVVLTDADGKMLSQTGYRPGGGKAYVNHLKDLFKKADVKVTDGNGTSGLSPYERMKAERAKRQAEKAAK